MFLALTTDLDPTHDYYASESVQVSGIYVVEDVRL